MERTTRVHALFSLPTLALLLGGVAFAGPRGAAPAPKVDVCHATSSRVNPYVIVNVSLNAWQTGTSTHYHHSGDSLMNADGSCGSPAPVCEELAGSWTMTSDGDTSCTTLVGDSCNFSFSIGLDSLVGSSADGSTLTLSSADGSITCTGTVAGANQIDMICDDGTSTFALTLTDPGLCIPGIEF